MILNNTTLQMLKKLAPLLDDDKLKIIRKEVKKAYKKKGEWDKEHEFELEKFLENIKRK